MTRSQEPVDELVDSVAGDARTHELFAGVDRLVVGCSAGGDSLALLHLMHGMRDRFALRLAAAHLDHGWRGAESAEEAEHVEAEAGELGIPVFTERIEPGPDQAFDEAAGRRARHAFFRRVLDEWDGDAVALGHTLDDQAETILLNLARGAGRRGLGGMSPRTELDGLLVLRPLLGVRREVLREYLEGLGREWREDPANRSERFARVRVRRRLLPLLAEVHPGAAENLARAAALLRDEEAWIGEHVEEEFRRARVEDEFPGAVALELEALGRAAPALRRRLVRRALRAVRGDLAGIGSDHVDDVDLVVEGREAARDLPGVRVRRDGEKLRFLPLRGRRLQPPEAGEGRDRPR